ncbi:copper transporter, putative [Plasmodium sp. gorilla clade G2]|uniref:copper transporter, putative n=1 Tax=Plasmodium sp. gorilla clade G2 TaxID=880535 RepID=UPI000D2229AA|nr:copper transporter, putative [Plasmodium sp. gorilla clade G2]SOV18946.1 copper transporter, putative [Plasmodium sp. gorilla clade G2]
MQNFYKSNLKYYTLAIFCLAFTFDFVNSSCCHSKNEDGVMLPMYFSNNENIKILFDIFQVKNRYQFIFFNILCIILGFFSVYIKLLKKRLHHNVKKVSDGGDGSYVNMSPCQNVNYGFLSFLHYTIDYLLMLIVMTFNPYIFLSVITGLSSAYLFYGHLI